MAFTALDLSALLNDGNFHNRVKILLDIKRGQEHKNLEAMPAYVPEDPDPVEEAANKLREDTERRIYHFSRVYDPGGLYLINLVYADIFTWLVIEDKIGLEGDITDVDIELAVDAIWSRI